MKVHYKVADVRACKVTGARHFSPFLERIECASCLASKMYRDDLVATMPLGPHDEHSAAVRVTGAVSNWPLECSDCKCDLFYDAGLRIDDTYHAWQCARCGALETLRTLKWLSL